MQGIESLVYQAENTSPVATGGIADYKNAANILAEFGREGDVYIVHAAEGETVVPLEVLDANPRMKDMIFQQMKDMGLQPERYIVGNQLNSLNPITGAPEFFFKKLFKGIKKVFKKLAPIVLPIIAPFMLPMMPLAFAAGLGSLTAGLATGQNFGDALKGALITGGIAGAGNMLAGGKFLGSASNPTGGIGALNKASKFGFSGATLSPSQIMKNASGYGAALNAAKNPTGVANAGNVGNVNTDMANKFGMPAGANTSNVAPTPTKEGFFASKFAPDRNSISQAGKLNKVSKVVEAAKAAGNPLSADAITALQTAAAKPPTLFQQYAPLATVGLGATALANPKGEELEMPENEFDGPNADELLKDDISSGRFQYAFDPSKFYGDNPYYQTQANTPLTVAGGGEIKGAGTPTSDSIPAMLSDGEFVFNAKAVRGLGGGDRTKGAKKAYSLMKQYEAMG